MSENLLRQTIIEHRIIAEQFNGPQREAQLRHADGMEAALLSKTSNDTVMLDSSDQDYMAGWVLGTNLLMW